MPTSHPLAHAHAHIRAHTHTHTHKHTHTRARTHTHTHTRVRTQVDGGVTADNIAACAAAGANSIVGGTSIFEPKDATEVIALFQRAVDEAAKRGEE